MSAEAANSEWHQGVDNCLLLPAGISNCGKTKCGDKSGQFEYGQSYLCMTLDAHNMDTVAQVCRQASPAVYDVKFCLWQCAAFLALHACMVPFQRHMQRSA